MAVAKSPTLISPVPYSVEVSYTRPPPSQKRLITSRILFRGVPGKRSKVRYVPRPIAGRSSPERGILRVMTPEFDCAIAMGINDQMFIANKIWSTGEFLADDSHAKKSFEQSQERLWREKIDLMQVHSLVNVDQIVPVLKNWKREGKIRYVGVTHHEIPYFNALAMQVERNDLDFVQVHYSIQMRLAEDRILPAAMDKGTAVLVNMPFEKARLFKLVEGRPLPDFAKEFDCRNWAEFFLKWVISHPAITCAIPATSNPDHQTENNRAMRGKLPDQEMRIRMVKFMETIPGFDKLQEMPAYPGKAYNGYIRRAMNARAAAAK